MGQNQSLNAALTTLGVGSGSKTPRGAQQRQQQPTQFHQQLPADQTSSQNLGLSTADTEEWTTLFKQTVSSNGKKQVYQHQVTRDAFVKSCKAQGVTSPLATPKSPSASNVTSKSSGSGTSTSTAVKSSQSDSTQKSQDELVSNDPALSSSLSSIPDLDLYSIIFDALLRYKGQRAGQSFGTLQVPLANSGSRSPTSAPPSLDGTAVLKSSAKDDSTLSLNDWISFASLAIKSSDEKKLAFEHTVLVAAQDRCQPPQPLSATTPSSRPGTPGASRSMAAASAFQERNKGASFAAVYALLRAIFEEFQLSKPHVQSLLPEHMRSPLSCAQIVMDQIAIQKETSPPADEFAPFVDLQNFLAMGTANLQRDQQERLTARDSSPRESESGTAESLGRRAEVQQIDGAPQQQQSLTNGSSPRQSRTDIMPETHNLSM